MDDTEWDQLFNLLKKAASLPDLNDTDKRAMIQLQAENRQQSAWLQSFITIMEEDDDRDDFR